MTPPPPPTRPRHRRHRQDRPPDRPSTRRSRRVATRAASRAATRRSTGATRHLGRRRSTVSTPPTSPTRPTSSCPAPSTPSAASSPPPSTPASPISCCSPAAARRKRRRPRTSCVPVAPTWTIVRASWFAQNFSEDFLYEPVLDGVIALPAGDVAEPFVDVEDIADVAAAALARRPPPRPHVRRHRTAAVDVRRRGRRDRDGDRSAG